MIDTDGINELPLELEHGTLGGGVIMEWLEVAAMVWLHLVVKPEALGVEVVQEVFWDAEEVLPVPVAAGLPVEVGPVAVGLAPGP